MTVTEEMTVPDLARLIESNPHWVRGAADAFGDERRPVGTAHVLSVKTCNRIIQVAERKRKHLAHAS